MMHTLKIEWMKVKNYRTFWILLAIIVVSIPSYNYVVYDLFETKLQFGKAILGSPFSFPDAWQTVSFNASMLLLIPAILIITLTTNEFTYKTHRQNIIDGWSRGQFINVKLVEVFLLSVFATIVVFFTAIWFGNSVKNPSATDIYSWHNMRYVAFYFVQMISYSLIAFLISILIKRAGLSMGVFFIYMLMEQLAVGLIREKYKITKANYLPEEVTDRLIPLPFGKRMLSGDNLKIWENHVPIYLTVAAIYILIYCIFVSWRFRKADL
ncbi:MAG TPA: ABC transporter permease [Puia sp.]|nr:ABC transporter permease [Puia sp.]